MGKYKVVCTDLDGTLLSTHASLSIENSTAITELSNRGVFVVPTTGRTYYEIPDSVRNHPDVRYLIYSNGAVLFDKVTGETLSSLIDSETYLKVNAIISEYETLASIHYEGKSYTDINQFENWEYYRMPEYFREHIRLTGNFLPDHKDFFSEARTVEMLTVFFRYDEQMSACVEQLSELGLYVTASEETNIEIISSSAKKGDGVRRLSEKISVPTENIIAVGDSRNDIALLSAAGLSLAVENAHEKLKPYADKIICKNTEHVAKYILDNFIDEKN